MREGAVHLVFAKTVHEIFASHAFEVPHLGVLEHALKLSSYRIDDVGVAGQGVVHLSQFMVAVGELAPAP